MLKCSYEFGGNSSVRNCFYAEMASLEYFGHCIEEGLIVICNQDTVRLGYHGTIIELN